MDLRKEKENYELPSLWYAHHQSQESREVKRMKVSRLLEAGFRWVGEEPRLHKARQKAFGYMWVGTGTLAKDNITLHLYSWFHGGNSPPSLDEALSLKAIEVGLAYYDPFWHAFITEDEIWISPEGWISNPSKEKRIWSKVGPKPNYNWQKSPPADPAILYQLGFTRVV